MTLNSPHSWGWPWNDLLATTCQVLGWWQALQHLPSCANLHNYILKNTGAEMCPSDFCLLPMLPGWPPRAMSKYCPQRNWCSSGAWGQEAPIGAVGLRDVCWQNLCWQNLCFPEVRHLFKYVKTIRGTVVEDQSVLSYCQVWRYKPLNPALREAEAEVSWRPDSST